MNNSIIAFTSSREVFHAYGKWFIWLCLRYMRLQGDFLINSHGSYAPKSMTIERVLSFLNGMNSIIAEKWLQTNGIPSIDDISNQLQLCFDSIQKRIALTIEMHQGSVSEQDTILRTEALRRRFALDELSLQIVIILVLIQFDDAYRMWWCYITGESYDAMVSVSFIINMLSFVPSHRVEHAISPMSSLCRNAIIAFGQRPMWNDETPIRIAPFFVPRRVVSFLLAEPIQFDLPSTKMIQISKTSILTGDHHLINLIKKAHTRFAIIGYNGIGRTHAICRCAQNYYDAIIEFHIQLFSQLNPNHQDIYTQLSILTREARIGRALIVFRMTGMNENAKLFCKNNSSVFDRFFKDDINIPFVVVTEQQTAITRAMFGELIDYRCPLPDKDDQFTYWFNVLLSYICPPLAESIAFEMAGGYCLSEVEIRNAVEQTIARYANQSIDTILTTENITAMLNRTRGGKLDGIAYVKSTSLHLADLILPSDLRNIFEEVLNYARYRDTVIHQWGLAKYDTSSAGLSILLSGPPGTGKTLSALVLANELKRVIYIIDLSKVVDKYIGETEKKLALLFDEAEKSQAMLLFDEADALFAKRTSVNSSNDRYANTEVNFLLQRLESFSGVVILTTNLPDSLDEALERRIQFKIHIPIANALERKIIWSQLLPSKAPIESDVDFDALGREFEMSAGHIKNAIMRACIRSASQNTSISHDILWNAAVQEYRDMGHMICENSQQERYEYY